MCSIQASMANATTRSLLPLSNGSRVISFLDVRKYPPALQFLLMTPGPSLMLLAWLDHHTIASRIGRVSGFFLVCGRVPLMFYVLHIT